MENTQTTDGTTTVDENRLVGSDRVLAVLKVLALYPGGAGLDELTRRIGSPKPTVHRALGALRRAGLADQDAHGHYLLGDEFLRMAFAHQEARPDHVRVRPILEALAEHFGETAHYTVLDGHEVVYRAKVDPPSGAVQLTSTVGGRNPAHCTAVGKLLLSRQLATLADVEEWIGSAVASGDGPALERRTERTHCTAAALHAQLEAARDHGYSVDDQENEIGVNCIAVPVYLGAPSSPSGAVSVSAVAYRTPLADLVAGVDEIRGRLGPLGDAYR